MENPIIRLADFREDHKKEQQTSTPRASGISAELAKAIEELIQKMRERH